MHAYSCLKRLLKQQQLSIPELYRRIRGKGLNVNVKSLYRLSDENQPLERLDLRVAGAICQACTVPLSEWIVFEEDNGNIQMLAGDKQERLNILMAKNNAGRLTELEQNDLQTLVREAEEITLANARILLKQRNRLAASSSTEATSVS